MKTRFPALCPMAIAILLASGCYDHMNENPIEFGVGFLNPHEIMPLNVGYEWRYSRIVYDVYGGIILQDTIMLRIDRDTIINHELWYFIGADPSTKELLTIRPNGVWYRRVPVYGIGGVRPVMLVEYPGARWDSWAGPGGSTGQLSDTSVFVPVPKGTFLCYQYSYFWDGFEGQLRHYSKGVGLVAEYHYTIAPASGWRVLIEQRQLIASPSVTASTTHELASLPR